MVEYYQRHEQIGPFFMRWYWNLKGAETTVSFESLTLTADNRFEHYFGGHLAGATYGTWTRENNTLILKADSVWCLASMNSEIYTIKKKQLYKHPNDVKWVMKKKL